MKSITIAINLIISLTLSSCMDNIDSRYLIVSNESEKSIYAIISKDESMFGSGYYDEFKRDEEYVYNRADSINRFIFEEIEPNTKYASHDRPSYWDSYFESIPDKKIRLFIVPQDSVNKYGWNKTFKKNIYKKKYILSLEDLEKQNWKIIYK